jgi:hypothetical protein
VEAAAEPLSASEHIDQLNRLISSLRSQLQEKAAHPNDAPSLKPAATESDLGSLYAQQRSQKLGMRSGGEGRHLPRYLDQQDDSMRPQTIPPKDSRSTAKTQKPKESAQKSAVEDLPTTIPALAAALISSEASTSSVPPQIKITPSSTFPSSSSVTTEGGKTLSGAGVTYAPTADATHPTVAVKAVVPPKKIMKLVGQAVKEWSMIEEGDCLLLGLSGGKDSLALLHILIALQVLSINLPPYCSK